MELCLSFLIHSGILRQSETVGHMSFSPIQIRAARLLAAGNTQDEVGKRVGVSRRTVSRWLCTEEFRNLSFSFTGESTKVGPETQTLSTHSINNQIDYNLSDLGTMAIQTLVAILSDPDSRTADKLRAAALAGEWSGLASDFNVAVSTLRRYGLLLRESDDVSGAWILHDERQRQIFDE